MPSSLVPGLTQVQVDAVIEALQIRLVAYNDLHLTLKHVHWNVVGPNFIAVHEMLDPQVDLVRGFADEAAERIATLGGTPDGTSGAITKHRSWENYDLGRASVADHLRALDAVYSTVIADNRSSLDTLGDNDPISEDLVIGATAELEKFQWFIRSHIAE